MKEYIQNLKNYLENDSFKEIEDILQEIYSIGISDDEISKIDDILTEATLYVEFKEEEYKDTALELIEKLNNK